MKKLFLVIAVLIAQSSVGQDLSTSKAAINTKDTTGDVKDYQKILFQELARYDYGKKDKKGIAIQPKLFNKKILGIFNTVVLSNSEVASNGTSFGYQQDKDAGTISANSVVRISEKKNSFLSFGVNAKGSSSPFNLYNKESWLNEVGGKIGFIYKFGNSGTYYLDKELSPISVQRIKYADSLLRAKCRMDDIADLKRSRDKLDSSIRNYHQQRDSITALIKYKVKFDKTFKTLSSDSTNELRVLLTKIEDLGTSIKDDKKRVDSIREVLGARNSTISKEKYVREELYEFDKRNDATHGYKFYWFDANVNLSNATFKFEKDNISALALNAFDDSLGLQEDINKLRVGVDANFNFTWNKKNTLVFAKGGVTYNRSSFMNSNLMDGTPTIDSLLNVLDEANESKIKGTFNRIDETLQYAGINFYAALFIGKQKNIGLNVTAQHLFLIEKPQGVYYKNNFSALIGPIFRITKGDNTGATFGIDFGFDNAIYGTKVVDDFTARIRVGLPFSIYSKKKKG